MKKLLQLLIVITLGMLGVNVRAEDAVADVYVASNTAIAINNKTNPFTSGGSYGNVQFTFADANCHYTKNSISLEDASSLPNQLLLSEVKILRRNGSYSWTDGLTINLQAVVGSNVYGPVYTSKPIVNENASLPYNSGSSTYTGEWGVFLFENPVPILKSGLYRVTFSANSQLAMFSSTPATSTGTTIHTNANEEYTPFVCLTATPGEELELSGKWSEKVSATETDVVLTVNGKDSLEMDTTVDLNSLFINSGTGDSNSLTFTAPTSGSAGGLTAATTIINTDTDVSGISANLGAVTLAGGKQLTVQSPSQYTSISRANASILHVKGDVADTTYLQNNTILKTSGTTTINGNLTFTGAGWTWVFNKESDTTGAATVSGRLVLANASGASSYLTIQNGATLTIESANTTMGVDGTDGAAFLGNYSATTQVLVTGEGSHFNVPNGAVNLARDASPTIKVEKGALFSAYCLNGDTHGGVPTMTVENAELRLGKADVTTGQLKMVETKLNLKDAVLSANGDWGITSDSTQGQIVLSGTIVVKPMNHVVTIRKISGEGGVSVEGDGRVVFADDISIGGGLGLGDGTTVDIGAWHPTLTALGVNTSLTLSAGENVISVRLPVAGSITEVPEGLSVSVTEWTDVEPTLEIEEGALVISRPIPTRTWAPTTVDNEGFVDWSSDWSGSDTANVAVLDFRHLSGDAKVTIPAETDFEMTEFLGGNQTLTVTLEEGASLGSLTVIGHVVFKSVGFDAMTIADGYVVSFDTNSEITINKQITGDGVIKVVSGAVKLTGSNSYSKLDIAEAATVEITKIQALGGSNAKLSGSGLLYANGNNVLKDFKNARLENWAGRIKFKGSQTNLDLAKYGTRVIFSGATGYLKTGGSFTTNIELEDKGWESTNGNANDTLTLSGLLTGSGELKFNTGTPSDGQLYKFTGDVSGFNGDIVLSDSDHRIVFGDADSQGNGKITVAKGVNVGGVWSAASGIAVTGDGSVKGAGTIAANITFADGATLEVGDEPLKVSGDRTVTVNDTLKVKFANETAAATGKILQKADGATLTLAAGGCSATKQVGEGATLTGHKAFKDTAGDISLRRKGFMLMIK